ncbi:DNA mismatch repair protein Msh3 [Myxozyma melibiosi]|uniref:DNA mismatch repair protein MSH3 n=1 Tax=Myxozyma melibiosi TaxID=54550 RepID=A0ABR1F6V3_9ASCO
MAPPPASVPRTQQTISSFFKRPSASQPAQKPTASSTRPQAEQQTNSRSSTAPSRELLSVKHAGLKRFANGSVAGKEDGGSDDRDRKAAEVMAEKRQRIAGESVASRRKIASLELAARNEDEDLADEDGEHDPEDDETESVPLKKSGRGQAGSASKAPKLTPLTQQYIDIKRNHRDTILAVEVGYKYHFYGEDSAIVSKELNIFRVPGWNSIEEALNPSTSSRYRKFASSSVPDHRIYIHLERLIEKGYKVGLVQQTETAALKSAGTNKSGPFERKLTRVYTKATYVDRPIDAEGMSSSNASSGYIFCIAENELPHQRVSIGMLAISAATGRLVYEEFEDGFMRAELETRLLHIHPSEIVVTGQISKESEKLFSHISKKVATGSLDSGSIRIEHVDRPSLDDAVNHLTTFFGTKLQDSQSSGSSNSSFDGILSLPNTVKICVSVAIDYMKQYGLDSIFDLTMKIDNFQNKTSMLLNGDTLNSLEIFRNQSDLTYKGSLFWIMDRTRTRFGQRLLQSWIGHPLIDREKLELRTAAVEELKQGNNPRIEKLSRILAQLPDLETGLMKIHYGRCRPSELGSLLHAFNKACNSFSNSDGGRFVSDDLNEYFDTLPSMAFEISEFLEAVDGDGAVKNDKERFFRNEEEYPDIIDNRRGLAETEKLLDEFLVTARKDVNKSYLQYSTVAQIEYLIEIRNNELRNVPKNWKKISGTKTVSRFHPPEVQELLRKREQYRELLKLSCQAAYDTFMKEIAKYYEQLRSIVQALAHLDCLLALAAVSDLPGYVKPTYVDEPCVLVEEGRHPMVEQLLLDSFVPNDITLSASGIHAMIITGPNMGGKSSYVRQTALIAIMGQIGSYVPAKSATLGMLDAVYTRMGAYDNMMNGESTFMVELLECADIMKSATSRSLVLLDEIGRGTGPVDGVAIAQSVLAYFISDIKALTLFITHYPQLCSFSEVYPREVACYYMEYIEQENPETKETDIAFLYKAAPGIAHRSYGLNVAQLAGIPRSIITVAGEKSRQLEQRLRSMESLQWATKVREVVTNVLGKPEESVDVEELLVLAHAASSK